MIGFFFGGFKRILLVVTILLVLGYSFVSTVVGGVVGGKDNPSPTPYPTFTATERLCFQVDNPTPYQLLLWGCGDL